MKCLEVCVSIRFRLHNNNGSIVCKAPTVIVANEDFPSTVALDTGLHCEVIEEWLCEMKIKKEAFSTYRVVFSLAPP